MQSRLGFVMRFVGAVPRFPGFVGGFVESPTQGSAISGKRPLREEMITRLIARPSWKLELPHGSILVAMSLFRWRLAFVIVLCAVIATEVLAQPAVFQYWALPAIASGFFDVYVQCLGYSVMILLALSAVERVLATLPAVTQTALVCVAIVVGALAGGVVDVAVHDLGLDYIKTTRFAGEVLRWIATAAAVVTIYAVQKRVATTAARVHGAAVERVALDRQMLEARLQVMRAQIEPHFLFNTLANVKRLCQTDVTRGVTMLDNLVRYLRASLPQLRANATTLGQEADLVRAYLDVLQIRIGDYLAFSLDVPAALRELPFPPMMLLTLSENAIKHGIAPSREAARIDIRAREVDGELVVTVADTGVGFGVAQTGGTGIGLANTRARLSALYGPHAELALHANEPHGVVACIKVPMHRVESAPALAA